MLLFRSEEWIEKWCTRNNLERGEVLTLQQVWELSKLWYHNRLSLEYHGRSIEQVKDIFKEAGLVSSFWQRGK
jgi:phosphoribosyl-ATP pyrophosphohydrolase